MKTIKTIIEDIKTNIEDRDLLRDFRLIIQRHAADYDGTAKDKLKGFFKDLQHGGCISGLIGQFVYHYDCKRFYIKHIDALEDYKTELEEQFGAPIENRHAAPHYTFMCWLCFEEYCNELNTQLFEQ